MSEKGLKTFPSKMFEEPQAKRIRRADAFEDDVLSESDSDEEVTDTTTIKDMQESMGISYHFDYDLIENENGKVTKFAHVQVDEAVHQAPAPDDEAFEFRLFSTQQPSKKAVGDTTSTTPKPPTTKINIRSPTPDTPSDGRFVYPYRPMSYYFTQDPPRDEFAIAAVSGQSVLQDSHGSWPGTQLPWRVLHLPEAKVSQRQPPRRSDVSRARKADARARRKPSKKRRILLRTRAQTVEEKARAKEEHVREKKTRLNREKKVKRKAKEKAAKAVGKEESAIA